MLKEFNKIKLENGLEIYHIFAGQGSDVISVNVFYKVGSRNEVMGKSGIAHMLEHLNFKSTKNRKAGEFDEIVKSFGGVNNASTGFDYTHYFIKCSNSNLDTSLELYADIMANLKLLDEEFLPEREVVLEERRWRTDNSPTGYIFFRLYNNAFIHHPYHWTPIGFKSDIENWNIDDIKDFHSKFYQPQNAFIVICGDISKEETFRLCKKHFENIKNRCEVPKQLITEPIQDGEKNIVIHKESEVEILALGYKTPKFKDSYHLYLDALAEYLGSGKSSLLQEILINEKKLVNAVEVINLKGKDENLFIILAICNPNVEANLVKSEILDILEGLKNKDIGDEDLEKIKNSTKASLIYAFDSSSKIAGIYGSYIAMDALDNLFEIPKKVETIQKSDLKECAKKYFVSKNLTSIILKKEIG